MLLLALNGLTGKQVRDLTALSDELVYHHLDGEHTQTKPVQTESSIPYQTPLGVTRFAVELGFDALTLQKYRKQLVPAPLVMRRITDIIS